MIEIFTNNFTAIAGAVLLACFVAYLVWRNNFKIRQANAASVFRAALADATINLTESDTQTSTVIFNFHTVHLAAINDFRHYVAWWRRFGFDNTVAEYKKYAEHYSNKGVLESFASEADEHSQNMRNGLIIRIQELLSYAKQT